MNEDLARERRRTTFNVEELTAYLFGGQKNVDAVKYLEPMVLNDPVFDNSKDYFLSYEESYENIAKKDLHFFKKRKEINLDQYPSFVQYYISQLAIPYSILGLHRSMFSNMVMTQATDEQKAKWMPLIEKYKIIGTYAQTEIGHGSFVRGLETTATYDTKSKSFVLNSPTLTSTKWWPGSLGHTTTHAIVFARLITLGKDHGIHPFIVQLRSLEDHTVLPGRKVGFIGPKLGYNGIDNGYLRLNNIHVPRDNLLMKFAQVSPDGHYSRAKSSEKVTYIGMVHVRAMLANLSSTTLGRACTIAIRYSAVRRQSKLKESEPELQVLDYKTQQYSLLPLLATSFAFWATGSEMIKMYNQVVSEISEGNFKNAQEIMKREMDLQLQLLNLETKIAKVAVLHATSAGIKAFTTQVVAAGVEECRFRCGGHGYSQSSGLPEIYTSYAAPACTYEGENIVMLLQTARYLVKCCTSLTSGSRLDTAIPSYLCTNTGGTRCPVTTLNDFRNPEVLISAFSHRAERLVRLAFNNLQMKISNGLTPGDSWNAVSVDLAKAARAHCHLFVVKNFARNVDEENFSEELRSVMKVMFNLYAIHGIVENAGDFLEDQYINGKQIRLANDLLANLLDEMRPNAVGIVDGFHFPDHLLQSVLGRYDGNVYEHLMKWAESYPSNRQEVLPAYKKYLRPLIKEDFLSKL